MLTDASAMSPVADDRNCQGKLSQDDMQQQRRADGGVARWEVGVALKRTRPLGSHGGSFASQPSKGRHRVAAPATQRVD